MSYRIQVYGGDVGGIDEDFEADTYEEALATAREFHRSGSRPTEIYEVETDRLVFDYEGSQS